MSQPSYLKLRGQALIYMVTLCSGLSFLLFGYDLAFMGGIVNSPQFQATFGSPNPSLLGFLISSYEVGCLFGGLAMFVLADRFGRKTINLAGVTFIATGATIQAASFGIPQFLVGRIVSGFGLGMATTVVPVWLVECARPTSRGRMIGMQLSCLILGLILASWLDYAMNGYASSFIWRFPCAFQAGICLLIATLLPFLPESPRYLVKAKRHKLAQYNLASLRATDEDDGEVLLELQEIHNATETVTGQEQSSSWSDCFRDGGVSGFARLLVAMAANACQQLTGSNVLSSFGAYVFEQSLGMSAHEALLMNGGLQVWFFLSSIIAWFAVDRIGRRKLFIFGSSGMALCMGLGALFVGLKKKELGYGASVVFYLFYTFFTVGWQANMWIYPSELLPLRIRQRGAALCNVVQWSVTFLVVETTPPMINGIGFKSFIVYGVLNASFIPLVYFLFPETSQLPLEAVDLMFDDRDGRRPQFTKVVRDSAHKEYRESLTTSLTEVAFASMGEKKVMADAAHVEES